MEEPLVNSKIGIFTCSEIVKITSNFKTMIGKGGFGEVYFGTLKDGANTAVKILLSSPEQCHKAVLAEVGSWIMKSMEEPLMNLNTGNFTSSEIVKITSNFKTMIGEGGFGKVYFGTLKDGSNVAVKVLLSTSEKCHKAFLAEAKLLTIVHHENLVSLVGYCHEDVNQALIYDYMPNGNLAQHLSEKSKTILMWNERLQIALEVARGLEYLHGCKPSIVHRDLKPNNILFNKYMQVKIADFGLSRAFVTESASHISTHPGGTPEYIDPESWNIGHTSKKSDVYSFGIILLELVTSKPAVITQDNGDMINIVNWIHPLIERRGIRSIVDPRLNGDFNINAARKIVKIAALCLKPIKKRPDMSHVVTKLKECLDIEMGSTVLDETGEGNVLIRLYRNIKQKGAVMKAMEEQPMNSRNKSLPMHRLIKYLQISKKFLRKELRKFRKSLPWLSE